MSCTLRLFANSPGLGKVDITCSYVFACPELTNLKLASFSKEFELVLNGIAACCWGEGVLCADRRSTINL